MTRSLQDTPRLGNGQAGLCQELALQEDTSMLPKKAKWAGSCSSCPSKRELWSSHSTGLRRAMTLDVCNQTHILWAGRHSVTIFLVL